MRSIVIIFLTFIWSALIHANDINIATTTKNGNTTFFLQAGAFNLEKDAQQRQKELAALINEPVEIKNLADKRLYLVQIGPVNDYLSARALQTKLSQKTSVPIPQQNDTRLPVLLPPIPSENLNKQTAALDPPILFENANKQTPILPPPTLFENTNKQTLVLPTPAILENTSKQALTFPPPTLSENTNSQTPPENASNSAPELSPATPAEYPSETAYPSENTKQQTQTMPRNANVWNLRNADIRAVIAEISRVTGKNFVIDPRVQGKISIVSSTPMNNNELYQVFLSILQVSGYAAIPNGTIIKIIPNMDAKTQSPDLLSEMRHPPKGEDMMVAVIPVHYVPAEQLVPVLRPLMPQWSSISAYSPSNMLILSGRANNIRSLSEIIRQVDNSSASGIDMVHLRHSLAMDIAATLKDLVKTQPNMAGARTQLTVAADDRSNSLLISGSKTDRIRLRMLILKLDKKSSEGLNSNTQVVYLNYLRAEDLVPILAGIAQANFTGNVGTTIGTITRPALDSTNPASNLASTGSNNLQSSGSSTSAGSSASPLTASGATANTSTATTQNEGSTKPTVQIIAEPNTNSIILNAPASIIHILKKVINQLDIKPAQLLIEALVAEINQDDANDLGIEWGSNQQTRNPANFRPGFAIINGRSRVDDLQAQIYALARAHKANILSTPSVVVLDNRQAKILVGKQVSIASTSYPNNAGGTTVASPFTTFDRVNVALHLYVRPQITRGQGIQMQIDQGNDTLDPPVIAETSVTPTFRISSIVTSVHVESGDVVVLGGLTQDSLSFDDNRLPVLGDIPGLGRLFSRNINRRQKNVLMVFIKPIILRSERDNMHLTGEKYNNIRQNELAWLRSQDAFVQSNNATVLPALKRAELPKPFYRPNQLVTK